MGRNGQSRMRGDRTYAKPALAADELVDRLIGQGLVVADRERAIRYIARVGYFRLSPYAIPFRDPTGDRRFDVGTEFDDVLELYVLDRQLRMVTLDALERVEVAVRAAVTDEMSRRHGPHWYVEPEHFSRTGGHDRLLARVRERSSEQLSRREEGQSSRLTYPSALEHYLTSYGSPELPPSWLVLEQCTIGELANLYRDLVDRAARQRIAGSLGVNDLLLTSWLPAYRRVRNICAHHGRLWNVGLGVYPKLPTSTLVMWPAGAGSVAPGANRRLYPVLASLRSLLATISPGSSWHERLAGLVLGAPPVFARGIGFPEGWTTDQFWSPIQGH